MSFTKDKKVTGRVKVSMIMKVTCILERERERERENLRPSVTVNAFLTGFFLTQP